MRAFVAIVKREFFSYFVSPLGYLVLTSFLLVSGWVFMVLVGALNSPDTPRMALMSTFFTNVFQWIFLMLVSAIIAMRLLTEERKSGSIETLLTAPVSEATVVAAKFTGAWCFFLFLFVPTAIYPLLLSRFGGLDLGPGSRGLPRNRAHRRALHFRRDVCVRADEEPDRGRHPRVRPHPRQLHHRSRARLPALPGRARRAAAT